MFSPSAIPSRAPVVARFLLMCAAFLSTIGVAGAASAQVTTEIWVINNTPAKLTLAGVSDWSNQQWQGNGPPAEIDGWGSATFTSVATGFPTNGTGGTVNYTVTPLSSAAADPTYSVALTWSTPWVSSSPVGACAEGLCPTCSGAVQMCTYPVGQKTCTAGGAEGSFSLLNAGYTCGGGNGTEFEFELNELPPTVPSTQNMSGYSGTAVVINGANFDTNGNTQVFFNGLSAQSVSCPTSTQCTAVAPLSLIPETVPVTISVFGETTTVGQFTYLCNPTNTCRPDECGQSISDGCGGTVTCPACCKPLTCAGACGAMSDGCGGNLQCGGCPSGLVCNNYNSCQKCATTLKCGPGHYFDEDTCQCHADFCECGGVYPKCKICE